MTPANNDSRAHGTERTAVPLSVRRKLVESGQTLGAEQWHRLPVAARRRLEHMPSETVTDRRTFATLVDWLRLTFVTPGRVPQWRRLPAQGTWPWREDRAPDRVARALAHAPIDWATLDVDRRFGLVEASTASDSGALARYVDELTALVEDRSSDVA
ncbi:MAG: nitrate reductase associated protein [Polyangiales bacterium]